MQKEAQRAKAGTVSMQAGRHTGSTRQTDTGTQTSRFLFVCVYFLQNAQANVDIYTGGKVFLFQNEKNFRNEPFSFCTQRVAVFVQWMSVCVTQRKRRLEKDK